MSQTDLSARVTEIIALVEKYVPEYMNNPQDRSISNGNVAICIIDSDGNICGKMFGADRNRARQSFKSAWMKASQVWITGMRTGEYERRVFNSEIDEHRFGIQRPDFIGWEGGQPVKLKDGTVLSIGFSGFRGTSDLGIVQKAIAEGNL